MGEDLDRKMRLRWQDKSCANCRYFRKVKQSGSHHSECLLLGRTLGITNQEHDLQTWGMGRVCDGWKRCPKKWKIRVNVNPHWHDAYIPRETLLRLRKRIGPSTPSDVDHQS